MVSQARGLLGKPVHDIAAQRDANGEVTDEGRGDPAPPRPRNARKKSDTAAKEKHKGRNLKIPDDVFRILKLEALRKGKTYSVLATQYIRNGLPKDIKTAARSIGFEVVDDKADGEDKPAE